MKYVTLDKKGVVYSKHQTIAEPIKGESEVSEHLYNLIQVPCIVAGSEEEGYTITPAEAPSFEGEEAPYVPPAAPPLTNEELTKENNILKAQNKALSESQQFLEDCVVEMAAAVYA